MDFIVKSQIGNVEYQPSRLLTVSAGSEVVYYIGRLLSQYLITTSIPPVQTYHYIPSVIAWLLRLESTDSCHYEKSK